MLCYTRLSLCLQHRRPIWVPNPTGAPAVSLPFQLPANCLRWQHRVVQVPKPLHLCKRPGRSSWLRGVGGHSILCSHLGIKPVDARSLCLSRMLIRILWQLEKYDVMSKSSFIHGIGWSLYNCLLCTHEMPGAIWETENGI